MQIVEYDTLMYSSQPINTSLWEGFAIFVKFWRNSLKFDMFEYA